MAYTPKRKGAVGDTTQLKNPPRVFTRKFMRALRERKPCKQCKKPTGSRTKYCPTCRKQFLKKIFGVAPTKEQPPNTTTDYLLNQYKNLL